MAKKPFAKYKNRAAGFLLRRRWFLLILLSASAVIFEILEHRDVNDPVDAHFVREILFFGVFYPVAAGLLMNLLLQAQAQRDSIKRQQAQEQKFNQKLLAVQSKSEASQMILEHLRMIIPLRGICLFTCVEDGNSLALENEWWLIPSRRLPVAAQTVPVAACGVAPHTAAHGLHLFSLDHRQIDSSLHGYCLPLFHDLRQIGVLHLYLPDAECLRSDQISFLNQAAPNIAIALGRDASQHLAQIRTETLQSERHRIARQLHDTLGQNLAYLRLKLDQLRMDETLSGLDAIQQDLERMQQIANDAYVQMRQTLVTLSPAGENNFTESLLAQAQTVARQAGVELRQLVDGESSSLPYTIQHKLRSIFREAMNNVLHHAHAATLSISITWNTNDLTICLEDDGVGFDLEHLPSAGHFGLLIMQQRAEEIRADLTITTAPGRGTQVILRYPM